MAVQYFGLNEEATNHLNRPWQPARLDPNVFRFGMPWNESNGLAILQSIYYGMGLDSRPDRLGIVALYGNPIPSGMEFYEKVKQYLDYTPSNLKIQIWNEPNNEDFGWMEASKCRELILAAMYAGSGNARLVGPAMSPGDPNWGQYMDNAYADHYVAPAVHIYPTSSNWTPEFDDALKRADYANGFDANKPIYITEMALRYQKPNGNTCCGPNYMWYAQSAYSRANGRSNVHAVIYHRLLYDAQKAFDINGRTYFIDAGGGETELTTLLDYVR